MATPKIPIVRGKYPIRYGGLINPKKKIRTTRSQNFSRQSLIEHFTEKSNYSKDEDYGENEYVVEKILSHKKRPKGGYRYYLKWKDYPNTENSWEDEENIYALDLLEAYWRDKSIASSSSSNNYKVCSTNRKSAYSNNKKSSRTAFHESKSNGTANITKRTGKKLEKETTSQNAQLRILYKNDPSSTTKDNKSENYLPSVNDQESTMDIEDEDDSSSENESSSDSDSTLKDTMEIDEEEETVLAQQNEDEQGEAVKDANQGSLKTKLGPRKPKSNNCAYGKESLYDDRGVKSIIRNIDENWDPYVEEVMAIEPHDKYPNALWIYILWRGGFTSAHISTDVNKLCPQSIIKFYEKRIIFKGGLNYKN